MQSRILEALRKAGTPLDDDQLAQRLGVVRQQVNQSARLLRDKGVIRRVEGHDGKLINMIADKSGEAIADSLASKKAEMPGEYISEDEIKQAVADHLRAEGWAVEVAWGRQQGIDIEAHRRKERLVIEAKGEVALQPQQHNYFVGALGELVQRFDDPNARYGLALPNHRQYHGLVDRLPDEAKKVLNFVVYWVERGPDGPRITNLPPPGKRSPAW